jgi:hypothetical protein
MQSSYRPPLKTANFIDRIVHLMQHNIEIVDLTQHLDFHLSTPIPLLLHVPNVLVYVLIILNEPLIGLLVCLDVLHCRLPVLVVHLLIALQLVCYRTEEAVAIPLHFLQT